MIYKEEKRDLFTVSEDYYFAHCISADFGMGKGIVKEFNKRFDIKNKLQSAFPDYLEQWQKNECSSDCLLEGKVFNLITKERYFYKPTYKTLQGALEVMYKLCKTKTITKVAMPRIGCGLDRLQWDKAADIIKNVFQDLDIEILVCYQ